MIICGLTGGIACGKSTATKTFKVNNIPVVDADLVARDVVKVGEIGWQLIKSFFGKEYLLEDETIDRKKLGNLVFSDKNKLSLLNNFIHPLIEKKVTETFSVLKEEGHKIAIYDAALIIENNNHNKYKPLIMVSCPVEMQINRLIKRNKFTHEQAMSRINSQLPVEDKIKFTDYVIDTSGTIENSIKQTLQIISDIKKNYRI